MIWPWLMQTSPRDIYGSHPDPRRNQLRSELLWGYLPGTEGLVWDVRCRMELQSNCLWLRYSLECKSQHRCYSGCFFLFLWFFSYRDQTHHQRTTTFFWDSASLKGCGCSPLMLTLGLLGQKSESPVRQPVFRGHKQYLELLWSMLKWFSSRPLPETHPDHFYSLPYLLLSPPTRFTWGALS